MRTHDIVSLLSLPDISTVLTALLIFAGNTAIKKIAMNIPLSFLVVGKSKPNAKIISIIPVIKMINSGNGIKSGSMRMSSSCL